MTEGSGRGRTNLIIGLILIGMGTLFWLGQIFRISTVQLMLPFFFIVPGMLFFVGMALGGKPAGPLAIPGSIVTMAGVILLLQGFINYYQSWAYAWALVFPTSVGIGLMIHGSYSSDPRQVRNGRRWLTTGLVIFLIGGAFFELLIFHNEIGRVVWPGLMILLGAYLLLRRGQRPAPAARTEVITTSPAQTETRPSTPTQPIAPRPSAPPEFEALDMTGGRRRSSKSRPKE